ncbi:uncharacterized protein LOC131033384 isoform X2 [Cryptomeria japonica]|uniref:uncharacterized protein LOC131033384 isoform X2 n=1 Tax=Cryptomeria japonica TaxID=3369 RepID=UPI0025AC3E7C|nr:uncharacterized protein LOC131033384 isoform X2 [Cryptomeria japonica]XP_057820587.1 uncharacterized protein LOC131033384 isoform X2 [Cryptomeria japonica]
MAVVDYHSLPRKELQNLCKKNGIPANKTNSFMVDALTSILKVDKPEVDYYSLSRKELQNLCKKHGIPANKTNSFMADALTSILKVDKTNEFGSATTTTLPEDVGNKSVSSILKILNYTEDFTASKFPCESTFFSLEIQSQRKEPIEEDAIPSTVDTYIEEFTGENPKTETAAIDNINATKTSEAENVLLYIASLGTDDWKELYHQGNQQIAPGPDTPIALHEDALEELCQQAKFVTKTAYSIDEPASPHAYVEAVSAMTPIKDGCQDVEMLDQELHCYCSESPKNKPDNEHNFHLAEDYQNSDKKVESVSQMNCLHDSHEQVHKKSLLLDLQAEESRRISRLDDYKKIPFGKCLRGMNNLARAATLRADILAKRRGLPVVGNSSAYSQSTSTFHNLPYQSQNVQENKSISSILKIHNNREDFSASKFPYGSTFFSLEIQSQRKEPIEEDAIPSTVDTYTKEFTGENPKTDTAAIENNNKAKTFEAENVLLHIASLSTDARKELYHHANQQTEPGRDTRIALYEDVLGELCQQAKFVTRKGDGYSLCFTSSSSLCKDVNDRLDNDTKIYSHGEETTINVQRVDHWGQEELCQQAKFVTRIGDEYSLGTTSISSLCKDVNDRLDHDNGIYANDERTTVDMQRLDHLGQEKHCQQSKVVTRNADEESLHCTSSLSPCSVVNVGDTHKDKFSPGHEERSIHVEGVDLLSQEKEIDMRDQEENDIDPALLLYCERLKNHHDNDKNSQRHIDTDDRKDLFAMEMVIDDEIVKHDQPCNQPSFCRGNDEEIDIDDRKDLFGKEMAVDDETVKHDQPCNQPPSCRGNDEVKKSMVKIQTNQVSNKSSSFQLFVRHVNGVKQFVDLENSSSSEWMKPNKCELSELKSASCKTISKVDVTAESRKIMSDKITDFQLQSSDFERFSDQNPTTCSSKFLGSQNFGSMLPITKKLNVCRELRRTSSLLIPPHGANRGLYPLMTRKSSRLSYTFTSPKNTINEFC